MKTKGMFSMLATVVAIVTVVITTITVTTTASAQQPNSQHKYSDDAIVRDLKAGKLTVREAQMLQQQNRTQVAAKTATLKDASKEASKSTARADYAAKPVKSGKAAKAPKGKSRAQVKHLTTPHPADKRHGAGAQHTKSKPHNKPHSSKKTKPHHATEPHAKSIKPVKSVKPVKKTDKAATGKTEPVRKTAVKYIR